MSQSMNDRVAGYRGLVESLAVKVATSRRARSVGADYDELVQEGLIAVWVALEKGVPVVGPERIKDRMRDHVRRLGRQVGMPPKGEPQHVPYDIDLLAVE